MSQPSPYVNLEQSQASPLHESNGSDILFSADDEEKRIADDQVSPLPRHLINSAHSGPSSSSHGRSSSRNDLQRISLDDDTTFRHRRTASAALQFSESEASPLASDNRSQAIFESVHGLGNNDSNNIVNTTSAAPPMVDHHTERGSVVPWRAFYDKNRGLAYVLLAQVFGCLMNVTTRLLEKDGSHGQGMHPFQILFVRMAITTVLSTFYMWWMSIPNFPFGIPEVRWLLVLRGIGGFFGVFGMYYSLIYLPLADATVITFISPSISCFACAILLREPYTRIEQLGALISFLGVTLIARPATFFQRANPEGAPSTSPPESTGSEDQFNSVTASQRFGAVCVALIGVFGQALAFTTMRWIGKRAHPLLSVNYFSICCTVVSAAAMAVLPSVDFKLPANATQWTYLIFLGICGFTMQFLLSAGLQHEKSSRATNMVYTQMFFALIFDKLVFGTNPSLLSLVGSGLILGSAIYVAMQKESLKQREEAEKRRALEEAAAARVIEMQPRASSHQRDEERGLVEGMDTADDDERMNSRHANGAPKTT